MKVIEFNNVWEKYRIKFVSNKKIHWEEIWALQDINLCVEEGEVVGIIGENGAGKTTLLKLISGALVSDRGKVFVHGIVSTLMELGAGFNPEFTGRENIILNARMYGLNEENLEEQMGKIIEFAGLGKFIDAPIKYYSQGMYMRLAFGLAIFVEPDIFLIDDILAVGDEEAQQRCIKKILELKQANRSIILISHDMNMVSKLCDRVILLEKGKIVREGLPTRVIPYYLERVGDKKGIAVLEKERLRMVFNNGKINLSYDGNFLTKGIGAYAVFFVPSFNVWLSSLNLSWQIKSLLSDKIVAEGSSDNVTLSQIWILQLSNEGLRWQIEIKEKNIKEPHIDFFFMPQYNKWLTLETERNFLPFFHKSNWQDLGLTNISEGIVGISPDKEILGLPNVIIKIEDKENHLRLFNTGYEQEARVVQAYFDNDKSVSVNIRVFSERDKFEDYIKYSRNQLILKQQTEQSRLLAQRTLSSGNLRLYADLENNALRLYYKDKEITKGSGLHTSFLFNKSWHAASSCNWQLEKEKDILILHLSQEQPKLTQTWRLSFKGNSLLWETDVNPSDLASLDLLKFGLFLHPAYKTFFCGHQQTDLPKEFNLWQDMPLEDPKAKLFGLRKLSYFPAIVLENQQGFFCIIQNSDASSSCRSLQLAILKQSLTQQKISFSTKLHLLEEESLIDNYLKEEKEKFLLKQKAEEERLLAQRTLSSGNLRLYADLENKALRLYYKDKEITKGSGLHTSFLFNKSWHAASSCNWQLEKEKDILILHLSQEQPKLTQTWRLSFKGNSLLWQVDSKSSQTLEFETFKFGLFLLPAYKTFFCGHQQTDLPKEFNLWQDMPLEISQAELFGLRKKDDLPAIILKNKSNLNCIIQNSDASSSCRSLQLGLNKDTLKDNRFPLSAELILLEDEKLIDNYLKEEKEKFLLKQKSEEERLLAQRTLSSGNLRLYADLENNALRLYYKDKEITKGSGLHTSFLASKKWFNLHDAKWNIQKISEKKLILTLNYESLLLSQIWSITYEEENALKIKIEMQLGNSIYFTNQDIKLELQDKYKYWLTAYEHGDFSGNQYVNNIEPIRLQENKVSKVILKSEANQYFPQLFFEATFHLNRSIFSIYKHKEEEYTCLHFSAIIPKKEELITSGRYTNFEGKIVLDKDIKLEEESVLSRVIELGKDNLKLIFDQGKGRIFWKQKELTTGLGVYSSMRSLGIWHDSYQAAWQLKQKVRNKIIIQGDWPYIPISQIWQIELIDEESILLIIDTEIYEEIILEIEQTNLMLSSEYKTWTIPGVSKGQFLNEYTLAYDILPFRFWYGKPVQKRIEATEGICPPVLFQCNLEDEFVRAIVENTDCLYKARLLQYQKCNISKLLPKKYRYFSGVIKIGACH